MRVATTGSTPNCCSPMRASPDSLSSARLWIGVAVGGTVSDDIESRLYRVQSVRVAVERRSGTDGVRPSSLVSQIDKVETYLLALRGEAVLRWPSSSGMSVLGHPRYMQTPGRRVPGRMLRPNSAAQISDVWSGFAAFADAEPYEAADLHVLAGLRAGLRDELIDGHLVVAHERLVEEHELRVEAAKLALDDLVDDMGGLVLFLHLSAVDGSLFLDFLCWHVLAAHPSRRSRGDVHAELLDETVEVVGACNEVRLAVHFHEHPDLATHVDVAADHAL